MASSPCSAGEVETLRAISKPDGLPEWRRRVHYQFGKGGLSLRSATDCTGGFNTGQAKKPAESREEVLEWRRHPQVRFGKYSVHSDEEVDTTDTVSEVDNPVKPVTMVSLPHRGLPALDAVQDYAGGGAASLAHMGTADAAACAHGGVDSQSDSELVQAIATANTQSFLLSLRQQSAEVDVPPVLPAASDSMLHRLALGLDVSTELHARAQSLLSENAQSVKQADGAKAVTADREVTLQRLSSTGGIPDELPVGTFDHK
mmetsp:Transcript_102044/g.186376  ORF Transcript_102044/g.186376 Transcript_102044/m.186376 type:complete len:259 (-) Transcript_102044:5-781(-)